MVDEHVDPQDMASVKARLDQIAEAVGDDSISLDEALQYYEEAVKLGMKASELMEAQLVGDDAVEGAGDVPGAATQGE